VSAQNGLRFVTGSASSPSVVTLADDGTSAELTFHSDLPTMDATSVDIDSDGRLVKATSSARYKTNIQPLSTDTSDVLELEPRSFEYEDSGQHSTGLVAEEVAEVLPDLVCYDEQDRPDSVKYDRVGVYLVPEVDEHRERLADLDDTSADNERRIETLEAENEQLRERNEALEARLDRIEAELGVDADGQRQGVADD
jgi:chaperonin cofactor prefoldin